MTAGDVGASFSAERTAWPIGRLHATYMGEKARQLQVANPLNCQRKKVHGFGNSPCGRNVLFPILGMRPGRRYRQRKGLNLIRLPQQWKLLLFDIGGIGISRSSAESGILDIVGEPGQPVVEFSARHANPTLLRLPVSHTGHIKTRKTTSFQIPRVPSRRFV